MTAQNAKRLVTALVVAAGLSACVSPKYVVSDVTRHHSLAQVPSGDSFAIVASGEDQDESLAFSAYSSLVEQQLSQRGLRAFSGEQSSPDLVVTLTWSIEGPSPNVRSRDTGFSTGFGYGYGSRYSPFGYGYASESRTRTNQMFTRRVEVAIYNGPTYNTENPTRVFEGSAVSIGTNGQIDPVMPYILQAIFEQFPGSSGETKSVRIEVPPESEAVLTTQSNSRSAK